MAKVLIPIWFFGIDLVFYLAALLIGLVTAFYAYKVFSITRKKQHFYLFMGFTILSIGFLSLIMTSTYIFFSEPVFISIYNTTFDIMDFGFILYYIISIVAYSFFIMMYLPEEKKKMSMFSILPWWFALFPFFHLLSVLMLAFVVFQSFINWNRKRTRSGFAVFAAFSGIGLFHLLSFFTFKFAMFYIVANVCLILGFLSLFVVLVRVSRR
jgi:hypothetical protein